MSSNNLGSALLKVLRNSSGLCELRWWLLKELYVAARLCFVCLQYLRFARTLQFYGYTMFKRCTTDYPQPNTEVDVAAGNKELNLRVQLKVCYLHFYLFLLPMYIYVR